ATPWSFPAPTPAISQHWTMFTDKGIDLMDRSNARNMRGGRARIVQRKQPVVFHAPHRKKAKSPSLSVGAKPGSMLIPRVSKVHGVPNREKSGRVESHARTAEEQESD